MIIAKANLTRNWGLLSGTSNVSALGDNLILGINTTLSLNLLSLLIILHWSTFLLTFNTTILVPLQSPSSGSKLLNKITGEPTLRQRKARDNSTSIELLKKLCRIGMVYSIFSRHKVYTSQYIDLYIWVELSKNGLINIMYLIISRTENNAIQEILVILSPWLPIPR